MVRAIPFWNLQKKWAVICSDTIFRLVLVCSADLSRLFSLRHVKFYTFMFMHRNSTQVVCVKGRHTRIPDSTKKIGRIPEFTSKNWLDSGIHEQKSARFRNSDSLTCQSTQLHFLLSFSLPFFTCGSDRLEWQAFFVVLSCVRSVPSCLVGMCTRKLF